MDVPRHKSPTLVRRALQVTTSLNTEGEASPFLRVSRGLYWLRTRPAPAVPAVPSLDAELGGDLVVEEEEVAEAEDPVLVSSFGMFWRRDGVDWLTSCPELKGRQLRNSRPVDFSPQRGVYLLHDRGATVYVGRAIRQPLGVRLKQHTQDRLNGRWERFSWFGVCPVGEKGDIGSAAPATLAPHALVGTLEALLIEGLEPPQNRRRGDGFRALEFVQQMDPQAQAGVTK